MQKPEGIVPSRPIFVSSLEATVSHARLDGYQCGLHKMLPIERGLSDAVLPADLTDPHLESLDNCPRNVVCLDKPEYVARLHGKISNPLIFDARNYSASLFNYTKPGRISIWL